MAPKVGKKRKSSDDENLDLTVPCRHCDKNFPRCQSLQCSRNRHYSCVHCLRIAAEDIVFEGGSNFDHERKAINCYKNKCSGVFPFEDLKVHLIPEMAAALNAVMTKFNCAVCFLDFSMKDGITCQKAVQTDEDNESHTFCFECIKEFAATDEAILAHGGVGLGCMQPECERALMMNKIKSHLSSAVIKRLEERVMEENIGHAEIEGLQRCQKCNYAVEVIGGRYFICVCGHKQCIKCGDKFDSTHNDYNCENKKRKGEQTVDDQINDVIVRFCHKCKLQFVKSSGCNFMKCRCGATQCYICREKNINNDHFCKCPGLQEECSCTKRCRQFADASHIDAHRIELLKSHITSGRKISNQEILQSMPNHNIPEYEDSDQDDDDDDGENDDDDEENDFDVDSEGEDNELRNYLVMGPHRTTNPWNLESDSNVLLNRNRSIQGRAFTESDEDDQYRPTRRYRESIVRRRVSPQSSIPLETVTRRRLPSSSSSDSSNFSAENILQPSTSTQRRPPPRVQLLAQTNTRPHLTSSSSSDSYVGNIIVPPSTRRPLSSSSSDSSDENVAVVPSTRRSVQTFSSIFGDSDDSDDALNRNEVIHLDSSDDDVIEDSDEDDVFPVDSDHGTVQLDDSSEDEVVQESVNATSAEEDEIDSDDIFESADENSTQAPTIEIPETEDESDSDILESEGEDAEVDDIGMDSDDFLDTSDYEIEYSTDEW